MVTPEMILAFLKIVEHGNISSAANAMYTTQSNLSKQIRLLEEELGVTLLIRKKGHQSVSLTPHGREFLKLSGKWQSLMNDFQEIKNTSSITEVSIAALDRMNSFTFRDFYRMVLTEWQDIRIDIHTRHAKEIYAMMEAQTIDLGFVGTMLPTHRCTIRPIYYEPMLIVCSADTKLGTVVSPEDLDPNKEVYSRWSDEFEIWHDQYWPGKKYRIHVGTTSMTPDYLDEEGRWSIVPVSTLHALLENNRFSHHSLSVEPPKRTIYLLEQKQPRQSREAAITRVRNGILDYLSHDPFIELLDTE
jgi:DNA-binding transcriptional LysR family regulator